MKEFFKRCFLSLLLLLSNGTTHGLSLSSSSDGKVGSTLKEKNVLYWFRDHALRLSDNEAFYNAINRVNNDNDGANKLIPVYLWNSIPSRESCNENGAPLTYVDEKIGGSASQVFIVDALNGINASLSGKLTIGALDIAPSIDLSDNEYCHCITAGAMSELKYIDAIINELTSLCKVSDVNEVYYLESYHEELEQIIKIKLKEAGIQVHAYKGAVSLFDYSKNKVPWKEIVLEHPWRSPLIPFVNYTFRQLEAYPIEPIPKVELQDKVLEKANDSYSRSCLVNDLYAYVGRTKGGTRWGDSILKCWPADESSASIALKSFLNSLHERDGSKRTHLQSRLSPYLSRGIISPKQVYHGIMKASKTADVDSLIRRLCWRDYTYAVSSLYPDVTAGKNIREGYEFLDEVDNLSADEEKLRFESWKRGKTGFPLVDAGQRQLIAQGYMPQKVRLASSTFLVEGLGISWRKGMRHFSEYLVDFDEAINSNMWMNAACVGLDPYYFGLDFKKRAYWDTDGSYVRKWCPELKDLPDFVEIPARGKITWKKVDTLYNPWFAPPNILAEADVLLGETYPHRICDERKIRSNLLAKIRRRRSEWPASMTDDRKRDTVALGREQGSVRIGMFTPRAIM